MGHCPVKNKSGLLEQGGPAQEAGSRRVQNLDAWIKVMRKEMCGRLLGNRNVEDAALRKLQKSLFQTRLGEGITDRSE